MSGIYIHVPFCYQRCYYCDFYSTLKLSEIETFVNVLNTEIFKRKKFLERDIVDTIYFGGGTPSVIKPEQIERIIEHIYSYYDMSEDVEITLEANPDDLDRKYFDELIKTRINRLSIGIQSFNNNDLKKLNRRHDSDGAINAVNYAYDYGYRKLSLDLIYGLPEQNLNSWKKNLQKAVNLPVDHISAYHLTYEKGTKFYTWLKNGKLKELEEELSLDLFRTTVEVLESSGFEQYEISNFARNKQYSRHNTKYWFGEKYLGVGPSAHSYDGKSRYWNVSDLRKWIQYKNDNDIVLEKEILDKKIRRNEVIMTRLRTKWGISEVEFIGEFGYENWKTLLAMASNFIEKDLMMLKNEALNITRKGKFLSDGIITELFIV